MSAKQKRILARILVSFGLSITISLIHINNYIKLGLFIVPYLIIGYDILSGAVRGIINKQPFDENFLMAVATVGAFCLGDYAEAVFVMVFYQTGELFQSYAVGRSRKSISDLLDIRPDYTNVENDKGELVRVDPYDVEVGQFVFVKPGERIALDGVVVEGESTLDTSALTGESMPRRVCVSDSVLSGCINMSGKLKIQVTKEFDDSTVSKVLDLVENATSRKSRSERFIKRFAKSYTPIVCYAALFLAFFPPIVQLIATGTNTFGEWIYRALTFLVISCPCALVVSVPLSFFAGIGCAGNKGILIKGANYLEALAYTKYAVFDKTGTLTEGVFKVIDVRCDGCSEEELVEMAAMAEIFSNHPISEAIRSYCEKKLDKRLVSCFTELSGYGVSAKIDNRFVLVGSAELMKKYDIIFSETDTLETVCYVACDGKYLGYMVISDVIKESSGEAVKELKAIGIKECVMLTGDRKAVGERVSKELGIDRVYSQLLPADKVNRLEEIMLCKNKKDTVVFAGDGINDAPVLAGADVGIAMGALGSDAAIEAADVVLMDDDPRKIALAVKISKKCMTIVYQNIYFAIGIKALFLLLGALGITNMWLAIFADVGVMVIAVLNSIRALRI